MVDGAGDLLFALLPQPRQSGTPLGKVTAEAAAVIVYPSGETLKAWEEERRFWR